MEKANILNVVLVLLMMCFTAFSFIHLCALGVFPLMVAIVVIYAIVLVWLVYLCYKSVRQNPDSKLFIFFVALYVVFSTILLGLVMAFTFRYTGASINSELSQSALGGVSMDSIGIWTRDTSAVNFAVEYKQVGQATWTKSSSVPLGAQSDFTGVIRLSGLQPNTTYDYRTLRQDNSAIAQGTFRTLSAGGSVLTFAWGSCLMVGRTFSRKLEGLSKLQAASPDFYFLIGDNIYADIPWLNIGLGTVDRYRSSYRETIGTEDFARLRASVPGYYQLDDHEFINNYDEPNTTDLYKTGRQAFNEYLGSSNPIGDPSEYFFNFSTGKTTFFVLDTRAHRPQFIIGPAQMAAVQTWLTNAQQAGFAFKFMISPQTLTQNFKDGWKVYSQERDTLLDFIEQNNITGCIFLSGDMHQVAAFELRPGLIEISASPVDGSGRITDVTPHGLDRELFKSYMHNIGFGVVQVDERPNPPVVTIRTYQSGGNVVKEMCCAVAGVVFFTVLILTMHFYYLKGSLPCCRKGQDDSVMLAENSPSTEETPTGTPKAASKRCFLPPGPTLIACALSCFIIFLSLLVSPDPNTNFVLQIDANNKFRVL